MRILAGRLGVPHTWIGKIEQAERRLDIAEYVELCKALRINPHDGLDLLLSTATKISAKPRKERPVRSAKKRM